MTGKGRITYNLIAGTSVERLAALSDGIFGVAMTLLLLDLHVPAHELVQREGLWAALGELTPDLLVYLMSFITLGIFWVGQQTQLNHLERSSRHLTWIHLGFLFLVTLLPFSTRLLATYTGERAALLVYWLNILLFGVALYAAWGCAGRSRLLREDLPPEIQAAICHRIVAAQALYGLGAALCVFSTYLSLGAIILVQLNYVLAPSEWLRRGQAITPP
jgi:uncharacterized membrane protein